MKRLIIAAAALLFLCSGAGAASRFWVPLTVSGAVSGTGGLCRLTVNDTANLSAGITVIVAGILGATACDGTTTVTTVVDSTHVEVNLAFNLAYTSGGTVAGGIWTGTGTGNWSATSGGSGGQSVPGAADTATLDGSSGGGTIVINTNFSVTSLTVSTFTGTLDFSVNNNSPTIGTFTCTGSGTRTVNMGNGTWTITANSGTVWSTLGATNLTFNANSSTLVISASTVLSRTVSINNSTTLNVLSLAANASAGVLILNPGASAVITTLQIASPNNVTFPTGVVTTITNAFSLNGTSTAPLSIGSATPGTVSNISIATGNATLSWAGIRDLTFAGGATFTANNSLNLGRNTGITINAPGSAGGAIIGGWLLWRDMPQHINDNFPAWIERAA